MSTVISPIVDKLGNVWTRFITDYTQVLRSYKSEDYVSFARVVDSCLKAGLTANELADEFKVSTSTISRWRSGKTTPMELVRKEIVTRLADMITEKSTVSDLHESKIPVTM